MPDSGVVIEVVAGFVMVGGLAAIFALRWKQGKGVGRRAIQAMSVILVVPTTMVLGLRGVLDSETVAAILGGVVGYGLGSMGSSDGK